MPAHIQCFFYQTGTILRSESSLFTWPSFTIHCFLWFSFVWAGNELYNENLNICLNQSGLSTLCTQTLFSNFDQHTCDLCRLKMNTSMGRALRQDYFKLEQFHFQFSSTAQNMCKHRWTWAHLQPFPHPKTKVYSDGATACYFFCLMAICLITLQKNIPFRPPGTNIPLFGTQLLV